MMSDFVLMLWKIDLMVIVEGWVLLSSEFRCLFRCFSCFGIGVLFGSEKCLWLR